MPVLPTAASGGTVIKTGRDDLPMMKEWAFDFQTGQLLKDAAGLPYQVSGNAALQIWLYWAVTTQKGRWRANSDDYGSEIERFLGLPVTQAIRSSELERTIRDAIGICPYVKRIDSVRLAVEDGTVTARVKLESVYGKGWVTFDVEV